MRVVQAPVIRNGVHAGDADGDVRYAVPPGPAEGVRDDHGGLDTKVFGEASRSLAAEASGSTGSRQTVSSPGTFEASTPALAQTKPWWVSEITMPRSMRTMRRLSLKTTSIWRGSFP